MNTFKKGICFSKFFLRNGKFLTLTALYFMISSLRWQPWLEDLNINFLNNLFSWTSWIITILPIFLYFHYKYIKCTLCPSIYIHIRKHNIYFQYFGIFTCVWSFLFTVIYGIFSYIFYSYFYFHTFNFILFIKNEFFLFILLNFYGIVFFLLICIHVKPQLAELILLIIPAIDQILFFYYDNKIGQNAIFFNTNLIYCFFYLIILAILYLFLCQIFFLLIKYFHITEDKYEWV